MSGPWDDFKKANQSADEPGPWDDFKIVQAGSGPQEAESALRGGISGVTAGFDDELTGALGAVGRVAGFKNLGSWKPFSADSKLEFDGPTLSPSEIVEAYRSNRDAIRSEQRLDMETNPKATIAGGVAGSFLSPAAKVGAGAKGLGGLMKGAAKQSALFSAGLSDADLTQGEVGKLAKDTATGAVVGAAIPPALAGAGRVVKAVPRVAGYAGRKASNVLFSTTDEMVSKYWAGADRINSAKSVEAMKDIIDDHAGALRDAVEKGRVGEAQAKEALRATQDRITRELADKKLDTREAMRQAENAFNAARERVLAPLRAVKAPTDLAADATALVSDLKNRVSSESAASYELLQKSGGRVPLEPIISRIDDKIAELSGFQTPDANAVIKKLQDYKAGIVDRGWDNAAGYAGIPAPAAKKLIQGLDGLSEYSPVAGSFEKASAGAFKGIRQAMDEALKGAVPEYRAAMEPIAQKSRLLNKASSAFGTPEAATGKIATMNTPRGAFSRETLGALEDAVGKSGLITREADKFAAAQRTLKDPAALRKIEQSLPEYAELRRVAADLSKRNPRWTREQIEAATAKQRKNLAVAMAKRVFSEERLSPLKKLTDGRTQGIIQSAMKGGKSDIENIRLLDRVGKDVGQNFVQMADDLRIKEAFQKGGQHGARNVVLGGFLGFLMGGGPIGGGVGASVGGTIDKYGPRMSKAIMDGLLKVKNRPTVEAIRSLSIPTEVKRELEREFRVYMLMSQGAESPALRRVAEGEPQSKTAAAKGPDAWARQGASILGFSDEVSSVLMRDEGTKRLLIEASALKPGSQRLERIKDQIKKGMESR